MLQSIARFLGVAALLVEARGGKDSVVDILRYGAVLVREGDDAKQELERLTARVQAMVDDDRDPTDIEVEEVRARRQELVDRIRSANVEETAPATAPRSPADGEENES